MRALRDRGLRIRCTGISVPQLAVAWVLKNAAVDTVLIGARTTDHIASGIAALKINYDPA